MACDTIARFVLISGLTLTFVAACLALGVWSVLALVDAVARRGATAPREQDAGPDLLVDRRPTMPADWTSEVMPSGPERAQAFPVDAGADRAGGK